MPDFAYIARDDTGRKVSGTISAANRRDVVASLWASNRCFPWKSPTPRHGGIARMRAGEKNQAAIDGGRVRAIGRSAAKRRAAVAVAGSAEKPNVACRPSRSAGEVHPAVEDGTNVGRRHAGPSARVQRNGHQHGQGRRRGRISGRRTGQGRAVHRAAARSEKSHGSGRWSIRRFWRWSAYRS